MPRCTHAARRRARDEDVLVRAEIFRAAEREVSKAFGARSAERARAWAMEHGLPDLVEARPRSVDTTLETSLPPVDGSRP